MSHSSGEPHPPAQASRQTGPRDFPLGLAGFSYADLYRPERLADLTGAFAAALRSADPSLFAAFEAHRREPSALGPVESSNLLIRVASVLSRFLGRLFGVEQELGRCAEVVLAQDPIFVFKRDFLQRRVFWKYPEGRAPAEARAPLDPPGRLPPRTLFPQIEFWTHAAPA